MRRNPKRKQAGEQPPRESVKQGEPSHLWYFESMDHVNRAMQGTNDLEQVMKDVLDTLLAIFECDRAWLVYPCDPVAATWQVPMERTRPEYPGVLPIGVELPLDPVGAEVYRILRNTDGPVKFGEGEKRPVPMEMATAFNVQSFIAMAFYPKVGKPWSFGLHQCSYARVWAPEEERLFQEIGRRLSDTLSTLLAYRDLQESERQIKQLIDVSPVAMIVSLGIEERVEKINDKFTELFGYTAEDIPDVKHWWPLAYPDEAYRAEIRAKWEESVEQAIREKSQIKPMEATVRCKDGSYRHIEFRLSSIGEKHLVTFVDLTERKEAEEKLRASEHKYREIFENVSDALFLLEVTEDGHFRNLEVNRAFEKSTGFSRDQLLGKTIEETVPEETANIVNAKYRRCVDAGTTVDEEVELHLPTGLRAYHSSLIPIHDDNGRIYRLIGITRDITERKKAAAQLLASEQLFRALVENSPDFIARYDREFRRIYVNPTIQKLFGVPAQNVLGKTPSDQSPVYAPQIYVDHLRQVIETATERVTEMPFRTAEGEMHWGHMRFVPEFGPDGKVDSVLAIGRDIHEIKENERRFRMLAENFPDLVMRFDRQGRYVYVNPAFEKATGLPIEAIIGKTLQELPQRIKSEENSESLARIRRAFNEGTPNETEVHWDTQMGERIFENRYVPEKDATGNVVTVLCVARDLTERRRAEEALALREMELRNLADSSPGLMGTFYLRPDGSVCMPYTSPQIQNLFGLRSEDVAEDATPLLERTHPDDVQRVNESIAESARTMTPWHLEYRVLHPDRGELWLEGSTNPKPHPEGGVIWYGFVHDITERKRAEDELRQNREAALQFSKQLAALQEVTNELSKVESSDDLCRKAVQSGRTHVGFDRVSIWFIEEHLGIMRGSFGTDERGELRDERSAQVEFRHEGLAWLLFFHKDQMALVEHRSLYDHLGREVGVGDNAMAALWDGDEVIGVISVDNLFTGQPISEHQLEILRLYATTLGHLITRKRAEEELQRTNDLLRAIIEAAPTAIIGLDLEGKVQNVWNPAAEKMLGWNAQEVMGRILPSVPGDKEEEFRKFREWIRSGKTLEGVEVQRQRRDGSPIDYSIYASALHDPNGQITGNIAVLVDITERKRAEEALRESEERYRQLVNLSPDSIAVYSQGLIVFVNPATVRMVGAKSSEDLVGRSVLDFVHPEFRAIVKKRVDEVESTGTPIPFVEEIFLRLDGSTVDVEVAVVPYTFQGVQYTQVVARDITERKHHEQEREAIITVSTALRKATTRTEILTVILDQLIDLFDADGSMITLPNLETRDNIIEMGRGIVGERFAELAIPQGTGVSGWVIENRKPYLNNHATVDPRFYRPDLLGDSSCVASVPLIAQDQAVGALWIARHTNIMEQELRLLNAIADIAANAIHRVKLYEQTVQQLHRLIALHQIDLAISANFDLNVTLNVILKNVKDELTVDAASILLLDSVTHTLDYAAGIGFRTRRIEQSHVKLGYGCAGLAAQEYRTVSYPDLKHPPGTFSRSSLLADEEFLSHYATPLIVKGQVKGVLEIFHRKPFESGQEWIDYFETLATQAAIAIESASLFENLQRSNLELVLAYDATIEGWSRALDLRDKETEGHTQRVTEMVLQLADRMGMGDAEKLDLRRGALLHDIGKMGIPDAILLKPGPLTDSEEEIMRQHPTYAHQMLSPITYLKHALDVPYCHHERWDGSGYPRGLRGEEIPLPARMFAVVDVFDALTSDRPYRAAWPREKVYHYIQSEAGRHFDPMIVEKFLE